MYHISHTFIMKLDTVLGQYFNCTITAFFLSFLCIPTLIVSSQKREFWTDLSSQLHWSMFSYFSLRSVQVCNRLFAAQRASVAIYSDLTHTRAHACIDSMQKWEKWNEAWWGWCFSFLLNKSNSFFFFFKSSFWEKL